jgi:hypothetical protein
MLDHVSLGGRSRRFYDAALRPLGLVRQRRAVQFAWVIGLELRNVQRKTIRSKRRSFCSLCAD